MEHAPATIQRIEIIRVAVPLVGDGFRNAYAHSVRQHSIIVRVTAEDGSIGVGNIDPLPGYSAQPIDETLAVLRQRLAPAILGQDGCNLHAILRVMDAQIGDALEAKAAIEMACVELAARRLGLPVHGLLGGAVTERVHFNAWIGLVDAKQAATEAAYWLSQGFRSAKIKLGSGIEADRDRVFAVREAVGNRMALRGDANAAYSVAESIALGRLLEPASLQLLEQPVAADNPKGLAEVRRAVNIPIMADESVTDHASLINVIREDCADIVKLKVMKQGGLLRTRRMLETASAAGMRVVIGHGFGLGISTLAEVMLAVTSDAVLEGLESVGPLKMQDDVCTCKPDLSSGTLQVPNLPGWGVMLDEDRLRAYQVDATVTQR